MRNILIMAQVLAEAFASTTIPNHMAMVGFISDECLLGLDGVLEEFASEDLPPAVIRALYGWYQLDEETFMEKARRPAEVAHQGTLRGPGAELFRPTLDALEKRGLSSEEITTELLRKYYRSLHSKIALIRMAERK